MVTRIYLNQIETLGATVGHSPIVGSQGLFFGSLTGFTGSKGDIGLVGAPSESQTLIGNGSNTEYTLTRTAYSTKSIFVSVNGLVQIPDTDYTVNNYTISFTNSPQDTADIEIRYFDVGAIGFNGSVGFQGSKGDPGGATGYTGSAGPVGFPNLNQIIVANGSNTQ